MKIFTKVIAILIVSLLFTPAHSLSALRTDDAANQSALSLIKRALEAMGGEAKLRAIRTLRLEGTGYRNALEQSERPDGPYIVESQKVTELRDHQSKRLRRTTINQTATYEYTETTIVSDGVVANGFNGGRLSPGQPGAEEWLVMVYFPEHRLLYASDLAQPFGNGEWIPQYLSELNDAVVRETLSVDRAFAMHMTPFAWSDLIAEINKAITPSKD